MGTLSLSFLTAVVLLIPGIVAYSSYIDKIWRRPVSLSHVSRDACSAVVLAVMLNVAWLFAAILFSWLFNVFAAERWQYVVDYNSGLRMLVGMQQSLAPVLDHPLKVLLYFLLLIFFARWFGYVLARVHIAQRDEYPEFLKPVFNSGWGAWGWAFRATSYDGKPVDWLNVKAVVEVGNKVCEYSGQLVDFWPDRNGDLDVLVLRGAICIELDNPQNVIGPLESTLHLCHQDIVLISTEPVNAQEQRIAEQLNTLEGQRVDRDQIIADLEVRISDAEKQLAKAEKKLRRRRRRRRR